MTALSEYARVPIIFIVDYVLDVTNRDDGLRGFTLSDRKAGNQTTRHRLPIFVRLELS
jgi:hypothetical protein